ncbi:PAS domain-containing sensor histidine kinase [Actinoplanes xinjiangensis]|uniref:PAS domain-containing sensor histidine kinase n=1 Tax=Actinoplanes xinjiangensis TaxID=512350 RepID=UPI00341BBC78
MTASHVPVPWDAAARLAARLLGAPMAVISAGEAWLGTFGFPAACPVRRFGSGGPVTAGDLLTEPGFAGHPLITDLGVRSMAAVPVPAGSDRPVRTVTVLDTTARTWVEHDLAALAEVAAMLGSGDHGAGAPLAGLVGPDADEVRMAHVQRGFISALLDSLEVGVLAIDTDRRPVLVNRMLRRFCGLADTMPSAEALTAAGSLLHHPDGRPYRTEEMAVVGALGGRSVRDMEAVVHTPGLPDRYALANAEPVYGAAGELLGAVSTVRDVTERRRRERFRDCELEMTRLLATADGIDQAAPPLLKAIGEALDWPHIALFVVDDVAGVLRTVGYWSAPGVHVDDLVPERIPRGDAGPGFVWATGKPLWIPDLTDQRYTETPEAYAFAHAAADRGLRASLTVPVRDGDQVLGVLATLSATIEYDEFLLTGLLDSVAAQLGQFLTRMRSRELTMQLERARDDFLTLAGHELRTPLTSIISYTTLLTDDLVDPDQQQMIAAIRRNVGHLQRIIDELLELTALESGHHRISPRPTDLTAVVEAAVDELRPPAGVRIHADLPPTLILDADATRLRQIVDQLLSNAVKYCPGGGDVRVTAACDGPDVVELAVADTGIGIPDGDRELLFTRFHRGTNARHTAIPGNGLGLPLVRGLVEAHGGTVHLDPGHRPGTRIVVRLPRHSRG